MRQSYSPNRIGTKKCPMGGRDSICDKCSWPNIGDCYLKITNVKLKIGFFPFWSLCIKSTQKLSKSYFLHSKSIYIKCFISLSVNLSVTFCSHIVDDQVYYCLIHFYKSSDISRQILNSVQGPETNGSLKY